MESNKILDADLLDIIFEGKNKEYGAYDLRKSYNRRLVKALMVTGTVILLLIGGWFLSGLQGAPKKLVVIEPDVIFDAVPEPHHQLPMLPPTRKMKALPMKTLPFTPPKLVIEDVKPDERPPAIDEIDAAGIGNVNKMGPSDAEEVPATASTTNETSKSGATKGTDDEKIYSDVDIESSYPGGTPAWSRFLYKTLRYPVLAGEKGIGGIVVIQFVVDKKGQVSDLVILSGPAGDGFREEVLRAIRKSGNWNPAILNGKPVNSYKRQPVIFKPQQE
jgi:protein TonB